jgi:hypothetical protein
VAVTRYLINESSVAPAVGASGWLSSPATSYTFSSSGNKTLYAWAKDVAGNISASRNDSVVINYNSGGGVIYPAPKANNQASTSVVVLPVIESPVVSTSTILTIEPISLVGVNSETADSVSADEAKEMLVEAKYAPLSEAEKKIYLKIISLSTVTISEENKIVIANFINQGTPTTIAIGAGERGGVISSFVSAFGYLPKTEADWQDVIKIANGRWPKGENTGVLRLAKVSFKTIYQRNANLKNANDNAAITVMAYGLRPAQRNLNSEKAAIKSYRAIFKRDPLTARAWDAVRAIAYSGAKR